MTKFMLLKHYAEIEGVPPLPYWEPDDVAAMHRYMHELSAELVESGEWVDGQGLAERSKIVRAAPDTGVPAVTDGPFAESKELLAGYLMIDVESEARAFEVAAKLSSAPGPGGRPLGERIQVQQIMDAPPADG